jgi:cytochrome c oxidase assembly protein subunit 15
MDFVIHRHAEIATLFSVLAVLTWWAARRRGAARDVQRPLTVLCLLLALQGAVGLDQYFTHLPTQLVWVHVSLACACWITTLFVACAAGALYPSRSRSEADRAPDGTVGAVA